MLLGRGARSCLVAALCSLVSSLSRDAGRLQRVFLPHTRLSPSVLVELRGEGAELRGGGAGLAHYLTTVLRMKAGHSLRAFNGVDGEYLCRIVSATKGKAVTLEAIEQLRTQSEDAQLDCALYFSPIRSKRMKFLVEKATEIGATSLHPVTTQNTQESLSASDMTSLALTVAEAAEQSERLTVPALLAPVSLSAMLAEAAAREGLLFVCVEREDCVPILDAMTEYLAAAVRAPCGVFCGPEGGFARDEVDRLVQGGPSSRVRCVSLGKNVLRAETASLFALSCISGVKASLARRGDLR